MEERYASIAKQLAGLDQVISNKIKDQKHHTKRVLDQVPQSEIGIKETSHFLHESEPGSIPVQNWKPGTIFHPQNNSNVQQSKNQHSAKILRSIPMRLTPDEAEFIMSYRHDLALNEMPMTGALYTLEPICSKPPEYSHPVIWKEYM